MWVAKRRALLDIWCRSNALSLNLNGEYEDKLCMPRFEGQILLTKKHCAPQCGHSDFKTAISYKSPRRFIIATAEDKAFLSACQASQLYMFRTPAEKCALSVPNHMDRGTITSFSVFVEWGHLQHAGLAGKETTVCAIILFLFRQMYLLKKEMSFANRKYFISQLSANYS